MGGGEHPQDRGQDDYGRPRGGEGVGDDPADGVQRRRTRRNAETLCESDEVWPRQLGGGGLAECVGHVLAQDAVAAVVDDQPGDVGVVLTCGGELCDRVHGAAVACDRERPLAATDRRRDGSRVGESEPARALGGMELPVERIPRRPGPVRGDGHVPERVSGTGHGGPKIAHQGQLCLDVLSGKPALHGLSQLGRRPPARGAVPARHLFGHRLECEARVGVDAEARMIGFEDPRFGIDVNQPATGTERVVIARHLTHRGTDGQQHVGVLHELGGVPVLDPRRRRQRVIEADRALAADGRDHRCANQFGEGLQGLPSACGASNPATGQDHRPRRGIKQCRSLVDEFGPGWPLGDTRHHRCDRRHVTYLPSLRCAPSVGSRSTSCGISTQVGPAGAD